MSFLNHRILIVTPAVVTVKHDQTRAQSVWWHTHFSPNQEKSSHSPAILPISNPTLFLKKPNCLVTRLFHQLGNKSKSSRLVTERSPQEVALLARSGQARVCGRREGKSLGIIRYVSALNRDPKRHYRNRRKCSETRAGCMGKNRYRVFCVTLWKL